MNKKFVLATLFIIFTNNNASAAAYLTVAKDHAKNLISDLFSRDGITLLASVITAYSTIQQANYMMIDESPVKKTFPRTTLKNYVGEIPEDIKKLLVLLKEKNIQSVQKGLLLYGLPGTGKTMLARCLAGEMNCPFFEIGAANFNNDKSGGGEAMIRGFFKEGRKEAESHGTAVIFIDEFEAIGKRDNSEDNKQNGIITTLLGQLDAKSDYEIGCEKSQALALEAEEEALKKNNGFFGYFYLLFKKGWLFGPDDRGYLIVKFYVDRLKKILSWIPIINRFVSHPKKGNLIIIAATNHKDKIDEALIRPGRFDHLIKLIYPDEEKRAGIIESVLKCFTHYSDATNYTTRLSQKIAKLTEGWSPADIKSMLNSPLLINWDPSKTGQFVGVILAHRKMAVNKPADMHEKIEMVNKYKKEYCYQFQYDFDYNNLLNHTNDMPIHHIENIFKRALLYANNGIVTLDHFAKASVEVEDIFDQEQIEDRKKVLNVLITLYSCSSDVTMQNVLPILDNTSLSKFKDIFDNACKKSLTKTVTLNDIQDAVSELSKKV